MDVLIADDDEVSLLLLREALLSSGYAVTKITGMDSPVRIRLTASSPELPSASWISARMSPG